MFNCQCLYISCRDNTDGVNCERCLPGYYRPAGVSQFSKTPCKR